MKKTLFITCMAALLLAGTAQAQKPQGHHGPEGQLSQARQDAIAGATQGNDDAASLLASPQKPHAAAINMSCTKYILLPAVGGMQERFVVIDSIDNSIDVVMRQGDTLLRTGHYQVDNYKGRHDVANIIRPKSIEVIGDHIIFAAEAVKDSGRIGILTMTADTLVESDILTLPCHASVIQCEGNTIYVIGSTLQGYDINIFSLEQGVQGAELKPLACRHYHVPKQSERIQASDPHGFGLTVVAVVVVFSALICIALIIGGFAKGIRKMQNRRAQQAVAQTGLPKETAKEVATATADTAGEVYAAIAAAIYLYQEDMHDEENTVLTISKVERAWTPWNAKFYNMNQYFNNRRR